MNLGFAAVAVFCFVLSLDTCDCFQHFSSWTVRPKCNEKCQRSTSLFGADGDNRFGNDVKPDIDGGIIKPLFGMDRRDALFRGSQVIAATTTALFYPSPGVASSPGAAATTEAADLDCLSDLPPIPDNCVRLYLCRHGQTENNRLRLVQGSRINPPINDNGILQAQRLGMALGRLPQEYFPSIMLHSPLMRARQTAQVASSEMSSDSDNSSSPKLRELKNLMEVDFGPTVEGQKIEEVRSKMVAAYGAWSMGKIDFRPEGGGDTGREILYRAENTFHQLVELANNTPNRCIGAVSHSAYLRVLLATFLDYSLVEAKAKINLANGSINILDVDRYGETRAIGPHSNLFLMQAPSDFKLGVPLGEARRINEDRHLVI